MWRFKKKKLEFDFDLFKQSLLCKFEENLSTKVALVSRH